MRSPPLVRRPTWELLDEFPNQGDWAFVDYLCLKTDRLTEWSDGWLEVLPMPDEVHQSIATWIHASVQSFLFRLGQGGVVQIAPFKVRIAKKKAREPDVCALLNSKDSRRGRKYWLGADVVFEVVSADDPDRDYIAKRRDYARAGIREYWIVDPQRRVVRQLALDGKRYRVVGTFRAGDLPASTVLDGWTFDVAACMAIVDAAPPDEPPAASR